MAENSSFNSWEDLSAKIKETLQSWAEEPLKSKVPSDSLQELLLAAESDKSLSQEAIARYRVLMPHLRDCEQICQREIGSAARDRCQKTVLTKRC